MERVERTESGEETGEEQGMGRQRREVKSEDGESIYESVQERGEKSGRKFRHERECGESKHELEHSKEVRSVRCAVDLDLKLYSHNSLSCCAYISAPGLL